MRDAATFSAIAGMMQEDFQRSQSHLIADEITQNRVNRYETSAERSLCKTLHELELYQAARNGQAVPLPVAIDVTVSGLASE